MNTKGKEFFSTKKVLSEPNVKVFFHQTAVHVTPLLAWIIYPFGPLSAIPHAAAAGGYLTEVDSLFFSRCRTCCSVGGRSSYRDPFLDVVTSAFPGQAGILYSNLLEGKVWRTWKAAIPSAFFVFDEKQIDISISEIVFLIPPPPQSRAFPEGSIPLSERRQA